MSATKVNWQSFKSDFWQLDGNRATLHAGRLRGLVELQQPSRGLTAVSVDGSALVGSMLGVDVMATSGCSALRNQPWPIADVYIRGRDLVATYREPLEQPFNLQLYWRIVDVFDSAPAIDLICSVQTPLWEAHPGVTVGSSTSESASTIAGDAILYEGPDQWSYVEVTRPEDFTPTAAKPQCEYSGAYWTFGPKFMEKGVIRRLQLRGAFVPRGDAERDAVRLARELAAEEPALTA